MFVEIYEVITASVIGKQTQGIFLINGVQNKSESRVDWLYDSTVTKNKSYAINNTYFCFKIQQKFISSFHLKLIV